MENLEDVEIQNNLIVPRNVPRWEQARISEAEDIVKQHLSRIAWSHPEYDFEARRRLLKYLLFCRAWEFSRTLRIEENEGRIRELDQEAVEQVNRLRHVREEEIEPGFDSLDEEEPEGDDDDYDDGDSDEAESCTTDVESVKLGD